MKKASLILHFFCLAFFCLVGLNARNDGGTGPTATAYYVVLLSQCSTFTESQRRCHTRGDL